MRTKIRANFHTHTNLCDGRDTPEEMASYAKSLGFTALGFSGHMDQEIHMDFAAYRKEIKRVEGLYEGEMEVLCGVELDTLYDASLVTGAEYIIGSTHYLDIPDPSISAVDVSGEMLQKACEEFFGGDYYALCRSYYELEAKVYEKTHCTFVGHFDLVTRFNDELHFVEEEDPRYYKPAMEVMEYLVSLGLPFEINAGAVNRGRKKEFYPGNRLLRHLKELGGEMIISSDAHQKELLNGGFEQAVEMAIACGFTHVLMPTKEGGRLTMRHVALA